MAYVSTEELKRMSRMLMDHAEMIASNYCFVNKHDEPEDVEEVTQKELDETASMADNYALDDPVRMYLKEIGKVDLLDSDEEIDYMGSLFNKRQFYMKGG